MTAKEARALINKANSKIYRLNKSQFEGDTPATRALAQRLKRQGFNLTDKGFISTKGLSPRETQRVGTQAQYFLSSVTSTVKGTLKDIERRTGTWERNTQLTGQALNKLYSIFDRKYYKRLKELVGSDNVIAMAVRRLTEKAGIDIRNWLYRQELALRKGEVTADELIKYGAEGNYKLDQVEDEGEGEELPF